MCPGEKTLQETNFRFWWTRKLNVSKNSQRGGTKFIPYNIETKEKEERKEREGKENKRQKKKRKKESSADYVGGWWWWW